MKYRYLVLFFLFTGILSAQNLKKIDSIKQIIANSKIDSIKGINYLEISNLTMYNDSESTLNYLKKADSIFKISPYNKGIAKLYAQKANYFYRNGKIDSARQNLVNSVNLSMSLFDTLRAAVIRHNIGILDLYQGKPDSAMKIMNNNIQIFKKYNDSVNLANAYLEKANIQRYKGFMTIALKESYKALTIHQKLNNDFRIGNDLLQIGLIYQATEDHKNAIEIFKECIIYQQKVENSQNIAQTKSYLARSLVALKEYDEAEQELTESLKLSKELDYTGNIARVYEHWGTLEFEKDNFRKSIAFYEDSYSIWNTISSKNNEANLLINIGRTYLKINKIETAISYFDKAIKMANELKDPEMMGRVLSEKATALQKISAFEQSLDLFQKSKVISDSIFNVKQVIATQELKTIYEIEKKEQQIQLQKNEIDLLNIKGKVNDLQKLLLALGLVAALIVMYALFQRNKRNRLEKEKAHVDLEFKTKELTTHALHLAKKNEVLNDLKEKAKIFKADTNADPGYQMLIQTINFDLQDDNNWENFSKYFEEVHKDFNTKAQQQFPSITKNDLRLMALLKMNLSSKEIANILNISSDGIKKARQRLRKKMGIDSNESLEAVVIAI